MYIDSQMVLASAQAVTSTGDTASTNVFDTQVAVDQGIGLPPLYLVANVATTATSGGSATVQAVLQHSADNSSWSDVATGPAIAVASVTAGTNLVQMPIPPGTNKRYLRVAWRVGTAALTAGAFNAYFVLDLQAAIPYTSGFTVA